MEKCIPFTFVYDKNDRVYDICSIIKINKKFEDLIKVSKNCEYNDIKIISMADIKSVDNFVPTSITLFNNLKNKN